MRPKLSLDFSSVDAFWQIMDVYQSKEEPSSEQWEFFFNAHGYSTLTESEFSRIQLKDALDTAFNSKRVTSLNNSEGKYHGPMIKHFTEVASRRQEIDSFLRLLDAKSDQISDIVGAKTNAFIPEGKIVGETRVAFAFFDRDARGYGTIVVDALLATELGDLLELLIAHEFHHQCRDTLLCYDKSEVKTPHKDLMWVVNQVQAEGIADQIDKPHWFYGDNPVKAYSDLIKRFRQEVEMADERIAMLDEIVETGLAANDSFAEIGKRIRENLPISGHPLGYHMSKTIIDANLTHKMIESVGNPFVFFELYNRARSTQRKSTLSKDFMGLLHELEECYC
ncbi:hypothetical protein EU527_09365 [Candidatus Thorarchaeota archaeon]|nr:MAG: hypothetical protein EU527_09365 [Candidatus Thorarchaeota archaeon]